MRAATLVCHAACGLALLLLPACSSSRAPEPAEPDVVAGPVPDLEAQPTEDVVVDEPKGMDAGTIMRSLSGRSFAFTRGKRSGTIAYAADGTFSYEEPGKGSGTGVWQASNGKLCEAFDPTSSLPKGTKSECHPFSARGTSYIAGPNLLTPT